MVTSSAVVGSSATSSLGWQSQRHGDHDPLLHAAAELMRIIVRAAWQVREYPRVSSAADDFPFNVIDLGPVQFDGFLESDNRS